ncbi:hypothetical protein BC940DRAFT_292731 [Gongronella butleri]|nr:hypothetical protein BC940DRAFT_292731 [Gongronella butleri]
MSQAEDIDTTPDEQQREELVERVLTLQNELRGLISRVDNARQDHYSLMTENQMLQKYIGNSLTSTAVFGATGGAASLNKPGSGTR